MNKKFNFQYVNLKENKKSEYTKSRSKAETIIEEIPEENMEKLEKVGLYTDQTVSLVFKIQGKMETMDHGFLEDVIVSKIKYDGVDALLEIKVI